jgi:hypothetical protein
MSQYGEHVFIERYFAGQLGTFLDVGAGDGGEYSNVRGLAKSGWSGVLIEPDPEQAAALLRRPWCESIMLLSAALVPIHWGAGPRLLFRCGDYTTVLQQHRDRIEKCNPNLKWSNSITSGLHWMDICQRIRESFDFINLDVEGLNLELLKDLPFVTMKPEMLCVELDPPEALEEMKTIGKVFGLEHTRIVGGNLLMARKVIV